MADSFNQRTPPHVETVFVLWANIYRLYSSRKIQLAVYQFKKLDLSQNKYYKIGRLEAGFASSFSLVITTEIKTVFLTFAEAKLASYFLVSSSKNFYLRFL